ncbi:MAG TPA: CDP-diacylglycerol--glycerol-3-phosphate 3-phosphatidyltransferase [Gemmataceae bacterium]|jgi:CDP-diacylglycerol--glycerol-3-phosphate 3-phosphatidyltransferase|nr:CDP-diacylglycerol--glycerol-3-phosphate 3-phosphatidyltransferase [Gemmataceae bacterium]
MVTASPTRPPVFNLPNQLTAARLVLAVVLFLLITGQYWAWCIVVFAVAALTDYLDGYFARKQGLFSTLGRVFDPLVDKVLICGAYIFLLPVPASGLLPWVVTVVVGRELIITGLRSFLENKGITFGADWLGKLKMGLQCAALFGIFVALYVREPDWAEGAVRFFGGVRDGLVYAMVAATALSGLQYLWRAAALLKAERDV